MKQVEELKEEAIDNDNTIENKNTYTSINEVKIEPIIADKDKYLPKWVLEMRHKVTKSRIAMVDAEKRIDQHIKNIDILDTVLKESKPILRESEQNKIKINKIKNMVYFKFNKIPMDTLTFILLYLSIKEVVKLEFLSKYFQKVIKAAHGYWFEIFPLFIKTTNRNNYYFSNLRNIIISHHVTTNMILNFIKIMKDQRCLPKHNAPRRYTRQETGITHPLPIFGRDDYNEMVIFIYTSLNKWPLNIFITPHILFVLIIIIGYVKI
jgi:hypothetical protein